jgi:hypothetical protein
MNVSEMLRNKSRLLEQAVRRHIYGGEGRAERGRCLRGDAVVERLEPRPEDAGVELGQKERGGPAK